MKNKIRNREKSRNINNASIYVHCDLAHQGEQFQKVYQLLDPICLFQILFHFAFPCYKSTSIAPRLIGLS
jgi:hypothetical protein